VGGGGLLEIPLGLERVELELNFLGILGGRFQD
jgi:hypothetical protein